MRSTAQPPRSVRAPAIDDMGCYFLVVAGTDQPSGVPSCLRLGRSSRLGRYQSLIGEGMTVRVPVGFGRRIQVYGANSGACGTVAGVGDLFGQAVRPSIYLLGETVLDATGATSVEVTPTYNPQTARDLAECQDSQVGEITFGNINPLRTHHRGGATLTVRGSGFVGGTQVSIGGESCTHVNVTSEGELTCEAPELDPDVYTVTVTNPDGEEDTSSGPLYRAHQILTLSRNGSVSSLESYWVNPSDGNLELGGKDERAQNLLFGKVFAHPEGRQVYVATNKSGQEGLLLYDVDPATATPSFVDSYVGSFRAVNSAAEFVRGGDFLVTFGQTGPLARLISWSIDSATGALTQLPNPTEIEANVLALTRAKEDHRLFLSTTAANVFEYVVIEDDGAQDALNSSASSDSVVGMVTHPEEDLLVALEGLSPNLRSYTIEANGTLTYVGDSVVDTSNTLRGLRGKAELSLYTLESTSASITRTEINSDGTFPGSPDEQNYAGGDVSVFSDFTLEPEGKFLYAIGNTPPASITVLPLGAAGQLPTPAATDNFDLGSGIVHLEVH